MKLAPKNAEEYFAKPDPDRAGLLIYGTDPMRVAMRRQQALKSLLGENAETEMRLSRIEAADLRRDPAAVTDAAKAVGFFPGQRAVHVEGANDSATPPLQAALEAWAQGDAVIVVTAGQLASRSKLRKLFEGHPNAFAAAIYDDPPSRAEIQRLLKAARVGEVSDDAMQAIEALSREIGPADLAQVLEKLGLYCLGQDGPVTVEDVAAAAPLSVEAGIDDLIDAVADSQTKRVGPLLRRLQAQGTNPTTLCIMAMRHFRALHAATADPGGPASGVGRLRPPAFGARKERLVRQAQRWGLDRLETALRHLTDTDLALRSAGQTAPPMAVVERTLLRLAMLPRGR